MAEQDRADVLSRREGWFDGQLDLDPEHLVFIDETWTATNMTRTMAATAGERMGYPRRHYEATTLVAGPRRAGMVAPMVLDEPIDGELVRGSSRPSPRAALRPAVSWHSTEPLERLKKK